MVGVKSRERRFCMPNLLGKSMTRKIISKLISQLCFTVNSYFLVLDTEPRTLHMLGKLSITEYVPNLAQLPFWCLQIIICPSLGTGVYQHMVKYSCLHEYV